MSWLKTFEKIYGPLKYSGPTYPSKKSSLDSRARLKYKDPEVPFQNPNATRDYTPRQIAILKDDIPLKEVRMNELTKLVKKAEARNDSAVLEQAKCLRSEKQDTDHFLSKLTIEEARAILKSLTPSR